MLIVPFLAQSMKIVTDEIDEFTGYRTVITSWEACCGKQVHIRFRQQSNVTFLDFKMLSDGAIVINKDARLMFKSTTDEIGEFKSIESAFGSSGAGAVGINGSKAWGIYVTYRGDLEYFKSNITRLLRVYSSEGYIDKKVSENDGKQLVKLYQMFASTIGAEVGQVTFDTYKLTFVKKRKNATGWDVVSEDLYKDISKEELQKLVDDWKAQSNDKYDFDVRIKKEK